jgi:hypothetical protein
VGEATAEAGRQIADARQQVEKALAMAHHTSPVDRPPIDPSARAAARTSVRADHAFDGAPRHQRAVHEGFWEKDGRGPWSRRVPAGLIAQLIGAVLVLALILVRVA